MTDSRTDFSNPEVPTSMREFYILYWHDRQNLNERFNQLEESQADDRDTVLDILREQKDLNNKIDGRIKHIEDCGIVSAEKIGQLERRVNGWNILNSLGVIIAAIMAALGLKGS